MGPLCLVVCAFQCLSHKTKFQSQTFKILVSFSAYYQASQELVDECRVFLKIVFFWFFTQEFFTAFQITYFFGFPWWLRQYNLPAILEMWAQSLGWKETLEKVMGTHSSILAWRIPMDKRSLAGYSLWGPVKPTYFFQVDFLLAFLIILSGKFGSKC